MKRIKILFLTASFLGLVPVSCIDDDCGGGKISPFEVTEIGIETVNPQNQTLADTSVFYPVDSVSKMIYIEKVQNVASLQQTSSIFFYNSAYACSPIIPHAVHGITSIEIISKSNLVYAGEDDLIGIGETITDRFLIKETYFYSQGFVNLNLFIKEEKDFYLDERFLIKAAEKPFQAVTLHFDIIISMADNTVFELKDQIMKVE